MKINQSDIRPDVPAPGSSTPGPQGPPGADSTVPGPTGADGADGTNGTPGADSTVAGPTGPTGPTGAGGAKGDTGTAGATGATGAAGADGADGTNGTNGTNGAGIADGWVGTADAWSYASASTITVPSGAASIYSPGMRIRLTQTTVKYFLITAVADTLLTVYGGTDYTVANAAISAISYSTVKAPLGFPLDPAKWTVLATDASSRSQAAPANGVWYNLNAAEAITIPIGIWIVDYQVLGEASSNASTTQAGLYVTLSTANNSESDKQFTSFAITIGAAGSLVIYQSLFKQKPLTLAAETVYYLNTKASTSTIATIYNRNDIAPLMIRATSAYL